MLESPDEGISILQTVENRKSNLSKIGLLLVCCETILKRKSRVDFDRV